MSIGHKFILLPIFILSLIFPVLSAGSAEPTPLKGGSFPSAPLSIPEKIGEREYLGLSGNKPFTVSQIKAELVIIEIFSMYCPYCQREAPNVNELYRMIDKRNGLRDRIKIIGIGAGNTPFEVNVFRTNYNIQFPLFSDESFSVHKSIGEVRTPYFFVVRIKGDGSNSIIYSKVGSIQEPDKFLDMILKEAGLK